MNPAFRSMMARAAPAEQQAGVLGSVGALEIAVQMVAPEALKPVFAQCVRAGWPQGLFVALGAVFLLGAALVLAWFPVVSPVPVPVAGADAAAGAGVGGGEGGDGESTAPLLDMAADNAQ
jgi:hypothetical protein